MILPTDTPSVPTTAPPAYSATGAPAPRYTPKKDFSKAFGELQGRYGYDGGAPILSSKDTSKPRSGTSTGKKSSFMNALKTLIAPRSPPTSPKSPTSPTSPKSPTPPTKYVRRLPSPARRIIESGPSLSYTAGTRAATYPLLRPVSSSSSSAEGSGDDQVGKMKQGRSAGA